LLPLLKGNEIHRYRFTDAANLILFPYRVENGKVRLIAQAELERSFPLAWQYLNDAYGILGSRENGKWASSEWWQFGRNQNIEEMLLPKIVNQVLSKKSSFAYDIQGRYCFVGGGNAGGYGLRLKSSDRDAELFMLGILNSNVADYFVKKISTPFQGGFF